MLSRALATASLAMAGLLCHPVPAHAEDGHWTALAMPSQGDGVRMDIRSTGTAIAFHFGEPANCRITAELIGQRDDTATYRFRPSLNGGRFCDRMYPGVITRRAGGSLSWRVGQIGWTATMEPSDP